MPHALTELAKDIVGLMDALGYEKVHLAGHDLGAAVAWAVGIACPQRVRRLAILNVPHPAVMMDFIRKNPRQMLKSWYIAFFQIPGLADWLLARDDFALTALTGWQRQKRHVQPARTGRIQRSVAGIRRVDRYD